MFRLVFSINGSITRRFLVHFSFTAQGLLFRVAEATAAYGIVERIVVKQKASGALCALATM